MEKKVGLFRAVFPELSDFEKEDWEENFLVEFTHDSTSIEGNTLTLIETKMILADKIVPAETTLRELDEVRGHAEAWQFVKDCVKRQVPLSESVIKDIHERVVPVRGVVGSVLVDVLPAYRSAVIGEGEPGACRRGGSLCAAGVRAALHEGWFGRKGR